MVAERAGRTCVRGRPDASASRAKPEGIQSKGLRTGWEAGSLSEQIKKARKHRRLQLKPSRSETRHLLFVAAVFLHSPRFSEFAGVMSLGMSLIASSFEVLRVGKVPPYCS